MPLYSLKKISQLAESRQTYLRGVSGCNTGWVDTYATGDDPFYAQRVTARVAEPAGLFRVEVGFDDRGEAAYLDCSCGRSRPGTACKHVVAVLVHKYYKDMTDGQSAAAPVAVAATADTDPAARQLMDQFLTRERVRLTAAESDEPPVDLRATLSLAGGVPSLTFTVGTDRPYVVKNLSRFREQMAQGEWVEYGKQLSLLHHRSRFTPESLPLLDFLLAELAERHTLPGGMLTAGGAGELRLSPAGWDRFFARMLGGQVTLRLPEGERRIPLAEGAPTLTLTVQAEGDGLRLFGEETQPLYGTQTLYLLHRGTLYRTGREYTRRMTDWVRTANRYTEGVYIAPAHLPAFCGGVLTAIRPYIRLEGDCDRLEAYRPPAMEATVYLDLPQPDRLAARLDFRYGGTGWTDTLEELRVKLALEPYFSADGWVDGQRQREITDDELFLFVTRCLPRLRQMATVVPTAAMQRVFPSAAPHLQVGIRLIDELLQMDLKMEGLDSEELTGILAGYRESRPYHRLRDGRFLPLDDSQLQRLAELAEGLGLSPKELRSGQLTLPKYRALYLDRLLREQPDVRRDAAFAGLTERFGRALDSHYAVPSSLQPVLRGYQRAGYRWLRTMEDLGFGGILADDMGLGKTLQVITLLLAAKEAGNTTPSLVVCPTSVVLGWEQEIARFAPSLTVLCVIGDAAARREKLGQAHEYDVLITSYDMLKRDVASYRELTFRYHILDEAQYIKNSHTQNARAVKTVRSAARFALTGTPVENRLGELWSIFDFLMPGLLFSYPKFRSRFETPILLQQDNGRTLRRLGQMVAPFILRRLKQEVLAELPPKTERVLPATMERAQRQAYVAAMTQLRQQITGMNRVSGRHRFTVLSMLTRLRQLCCDPRLCCDGYTGGSCKLEACVQLLQEATAGGHKVLLFSQFTSMLALLGQRLEAEGIPYYTLQGSTPKEERARLVEAFNRDATPVFLISLRAGGTGLNLTGADMVIHYDPWWNRSVQNQATDRAHRIGQKNPVQVVRLIARDTIEEKILQMQESKWALAEQIVSAQAPGITDLSVEELLALLE